MALKSGMHFLSSGQQQDAEEFLRAILLVLESELKNYEGFDRVMDRIKGTQVEYKKFLDNLPSGKCMRCGTLPSYVEEPFLALKVIVPICGNVSLDNLLQKYFAEQNNDLRMNCSTCCKCSPVCTHEGFCNRPAVSQYQLTKTPYFLFIQLLRFTNCHQGMKKSTIVE